MPLEMQMLNRFGLTGEEACQISWYAGLNEKLSSIGFYEYNPSFDDAQRKTAAVIATMIWYFVEGYYHRKNEQNFRSNDFLKYTVSMPVEPEVITFYKSKFSEKWWVEVPSSRRTRALCAEQHRSLQLQRLSNGS